MESATDYKTLSNRYSTIRSELDGTLNCLRKLLGNERSEYSDHSGYQKQNSMSLGRSLNKPLPSTKIACSKIRKLSDSEESLSEDEHPSKKVLLQSAVVAKPERIRSRKEVICTQNPNIKVRSRNQRILGMVQSTLRKFQDEEVKRQPQDLKRIKALEKVDAAVEEEKTIAKRQKAELILKTKQQELELKCLEKMMQITESFELWENNQKYLLNYNVTKAEPRICFLPAVPTTNTKKLLEKTRIEIEENVEKQRTFVQSALSKIKESFELSVPICTEEETSISEFVKSQEVAEYPVCPEVTSALPEVVQPEEGTKQTKKASDKVDVDFAEGTLNLDLSEEESEFLI